MLKCNVIPVSYRKIKFTKNRKTKYEYYAAEDGNIYGRRYFRHYKRWYYFRLKPVRIRNSRKEFFGVGVFLHFLNSEIKLMYIDRIIAETYWGKTAQFAGGTGTVCYEKLKILHRDGNKENNTPGNICYSVKRQASFYDILTDEEWKLYSERINRINTLEETKQFNEQAMKKVSDTLHKLTEKTRLPFFKKLFK